MLNRTVFCRYIEEDLLPVKTAYNIGKPSPVKTTYNIGELLPVKTVYNIGELPPVKTAYTIGELPPVKTAYNIGESPPVKTAYNIGLFFVLYWGCLRHTVVYVVLTVINLFNCNWLFSTVKTI